MGGIRVAENHILVDEWGMHNGLYQSTYCKVHHFAFIIVLVGNCMTSSNVYIRFLTLVFLVSLNSELWLLVINSNREPTTSLNSTNVNKDNKCFYFNYQGSCYGGRCYYILICIRCGWSFLNRLQ